MLLIFWIKIIFQPKPLGRKLWKKRFTKMITVNGWIKLEEKKELEFYRWSQPCITMSSWYYLWKQGHSKQIIDILWLLCGSLAVKKERFGNPGTLTGICSVWQEPYNNAVHHAILFCRQTEVVRECWWSWIQDHLSVTICSIFHNLEDRVLCWGTTPFFNSSVDSFNDQFKLECAKYIPHCMCPTLGFWSICDQLVIFLL